MLLFGVAFSLSVFAQVDSKSIPGVMIGDDAPWLVKLCGGAMSACLGIIWWQQRQLNKVHVQLRTDFREMLKVSHRFLDQIDKCSEAHKQLTLIDSNVAAALERRLSNGKREK
jgi:hypothetical protein